MDLLRELLLVATLLVLNQGSNFLLDTFLLKIWHNTFKVQTCGTLRCGYKYKACRLAVLVTK